MNEDKKSFEELVKKIEAMKKAGTVDLSTEEDLSIAIMNLISLEEHYFFSGAKTNNTAYYDMLHDIREMRKKLLARLMDKNEAESWCISKHLLATTMRLMEVGTKLQTDGKKDEAKEMFAHAFKIYSYFWALRLKIINTDTAKDSLLKPWTTEDIVSKLVNCCDE